MSTTMQPSDRWIPWYFVAFFAFIVAVNAIMITFALRTYTGTVTDHPYERGLRYNQVVAAESAQEQLGWTSMIEYRHGMLCFILRDKTQRVITPEKATVNISRPTQAGMDFAAELRGAQTPIKFPMSGLWELRVDAEYKGTHYQQTQRIVVP